MTNHEGNYAHVNGLDMYYEIHGTGGPLILLHGGVALQTAILPGTTHYDIFSSPTLASTVTPFLDAPMPEDG